MRTIGILILVLFVGFGAACTKGASGSRPGPLSSARPTDGSEEIPSFIKRPDQVVITYPQAGRLRLVAPAGTIVTPAAGKKPSQLKVTVFNVTAEELETVMASQTGLVTVAGPKAGAFSPADDGSFDVTLNYSRVNSIIAVTVATNESLNQIRVSAFSNQSTSAFKDLDSTAPTGGLFSNGFTCTGSLLCDRFTEAVDTHIFAHTPNVGPTWSTAQTPAFPPILSSVLRINQSPAGSDPSFFYSPAQANVAARGLVYMGSGSNLTNVGLYVRLASVTQYVYAYVERNESGSSCALKIVDKNFTENTVGNLSLSYPDECPFNEFVPMSFTAIGSSYVVNYGSRILNATASMAAPGTSAGFGAFRSGVGSSDQFIDDFVAFAE